MKTTRSYNRNFVEAKAGTRKSYQRQFHKQERQSIRQFCNSFLGNDSTACDINAHYAMPITVVGSGAVNWMF
jgi:hypothetical protein